MMRRHFNMIRLKQSFDKKNISLIFNEHDNNDLIIDIRKRYINMLKKKIGAKYLENNLMTRIRLKIKMIFFQCLNSNYICIFNTVLSPSFFILSVH